jgi:Caspase domain
VSYRLLIKIAALASTCWMTVGDALAESRMALVIGNSNYSTVTALPNPANDAKAMAKFLGSAGFQVLQAPNLTQADLRRTIGNFASMVAEKGPDTVALVFYAGHGLQVDGENFLVPVDANIQREADVPLQATRLADVMNALSAVPGKSRIVILDACRNNPFSDINKTSGRGLAIVDAPSGSLVSYSTAPGTEALDGDGANSPFTAALLKVGQEPGLPIEQALKRVRLAVNDATGRQQTPWESSSLTSEFAFFPNATQRPTLASGGQPGTPAARGETRSIEAWQKELKPRSPREAYEIVIREDRVEAYQAYLTLYPAQSLAPVVRTLVERRREMIAWHDAVTVNTLVAYETFLASYAGSDFAVTANRLIERARSRSVSSAYSAFASAGPAGPAGLTCPCSQPTTPRVKRADIAPTNNQGPGGPTGSTGPSGPVTSISPPTIVSADPVPPPITVVTLPPPRISLPPRGGKDKPPYGDGKPPKTGGDNPPTRGTGGTHGDGKPPYGDGKPPSGTGKPPSGAGKPPLTGVRGINPKLTRFKGGDGPRILRDGSSGPWTRSIDKPKWTPMRSSMTNGFAARGVMLNRGMMMNRGMSMGPRPSFGASFGGGRRFF